MDRIAYIIGETFLYWNSIVLVLAVITAICFFLFFYLMRRGNGLGAALLVPLALAASILLSRLIHWYCCANAYESMAASLTVYTGGGYALMGVFAGCALAAVAVRLLQAAKNLPNLFDCMALGGAAGIAVGRLACLFTAADRGMVIENIKTLPLVYPVSNAVTGVVEWRLATFMLQAIATGAIFLILAVFYLWPRKHHKALKDGDTAMLFLQLYCCVQVVLDSTRYDSLFLRSNGFVSIVQILCAVAVVLVMVAFSVRMVKARGFRWWYVPVWLVYAALAGGAGFMEYWVQRHGDQALFSYSVMGACALGLALMVAAVRRLAVTGEWEKVLVESNKNVTNSRA